MTLTWPVAAAVLLGALLHAGWNALVKSSTDKALDTAAISAFGSVFALPFLAVVGLPVPASWPYLAVSMAVHVAYYTALAGAYKHGDLSLAYPLMRGTAPLLVALAAGAVAGENLSALAWAGVLAISAGVLALGFAPHAAAPPRAIAFALANAVVIALYTLVDALGVRTSGNPLAYVLALFALNSWPFATLVVMRRGPRAVAYYMAQRWPLAAAGAAASLASYGVALWAMTRAPVAAVAALRETSVLFATVLAAWLLKEAFSLRRAAGAVAIVAGVMALRLG
jgi:phosphonate utilization associated putative membrane protein